MSLFTDLRTKLGFEDLKNLTILGVIVVLVIIAIGVNLLMTAGDNDGPMKLTSSAFAHDQAIPAKYTCDGENNNPPLEIDAIPDDTESVVLIVDDPDAPSGTYVHWLVWNIDPDTEKIDEKSVPSDAVEGLTSFGQPGYRGPCPPSGQHRYFFKAYALDTKLELPPSNFKHNLEAAMEGHVIGTAELVGLYARQTQ